MKFCSNPIQANLLKIISLDFFEVREVEGYFTTCDMHFTYQSVILFFTRLRSCIVLATKKTRSASIALSTFTSISTPQSRRRATASTNTWSSSSVMPEPQYTTHSLYSEVRNRMRQARLRLYVRSMWQNFFSSSINLLIYF